MLVTAIWVYRNTIFVVALVAVLMVAEGCRAQRIWTGIEVRPDGTLRLAAEEPQCGCLSVVNATNGPVRLHASLSKEALGQLTLKAGERQRIRFDWAASERNAFYEIAVSTPDGQMLDARTALEVEQRSRWVECDVASCEVGDLHMNRVSGER